jgi:exosortase
VVPLFSGFLVWRQRHALRALEARGTWLGMPVLLVGVIALVIGDIAAESFLSRSSLIVILAGLTLFHLGTATFRLVAFPLGFLVFMVPIPTVVFYALTFPLQAFAARNAAAALDVLGVPVLLDGNVLHLSQLTLGVTEACSGIRSLMSLVAMAMAWAYVSLPGRLGMVVLAAAAVPITVGANAARIVSTGLVGESLGIDYATGFFHEFSGWLIFVFALGGLSAVHGLIRLGTTLRRGGDTSGRRSA